MGVAFAGSKIKVKSSQIEIRSLLTCVSRNGIHNGERHGCLVINLGGSRVRHPQVTDPNHPLGLRGAIQNSDWWFQLGSRRYFSVGVDFFDSEREDVGARTSRLAFRHLKNLTVNRQSPPPCRIRSRSARKNIQIKTVCFAPRNDPQNTSLDGYPSEISL